MTTTSHVRQQAQAALTRGRRVATPRTTGPADTDQSLFSEPAASRFPDPKSMPHQPWYDVILPGRAPESQGDWDALTDIATEHDPGQYPGVTS